MPTKTYLNQASCLADQFAKHGVSLPTSTLLDTVANLHGAQNWAALHQARRRTLGNRLRTWLGGEPELEHVLKLEQLMQCMEPGKFQLGISRDRKRAISVTDSTLIRHLCLIGQNGVGATTLTESLIAQQILRGGGLVFVDPWQDKEAVDAFAAFAGRTKDVVTVDLENPDSGAKSFCESQISHIRVSLLDAADRAPRLVRQFFDSFWAQAGVAQAQGERFDIPFMVVIPEAALFLDPQWQARYSCARSLGIAIITHAQGIPTLGRLNPGVADIVLENSFTRVFFRQASADCLDEAVRCVEAGGTGSPDRPVNTTNPSVRQRLVPLQMGEMLVSGYGMLEDANSLMLRVPRQFPQRTASPGRYAEPNPVANERANSLARS